MTTLVAPRQICVPTIENRCESEFGELMCSLTITWLKDRDRLTHRVGGRFWQEEWSELIPGVDDESSLRLVDISAEAVQVVAEIMEVSAALEPAPLNEHEA